MRNSEAEYLLRSELLSAWWNKQEADAIDRAVYAKPDDDLTRAHCAIRVQILRDLRTDLRLYAEGKAAAPGDAGA